MATALTLAQHRDDVWRKLQVTPAIDQGGTSGTIGTGFSDPIVAVVNRALNEGINTVNRVARIGNVSDLAPINTPAAPIYLRGPYYISFEALEQELNDVTEIADVHWQGPNGQYIRLEPFDFYAPSRIYMPFHSYNQSYQPVQYFTKGNQIGLLHAPN